MDFDVLHMVDLFFETRNSRLLLKIVMHGRVGQPGPAYAFI